jgi:hypothetical protein
MHRTLSRILALAGTTAALTAGAAQHHICYQGESDNGQPTAVWGCRDDAGGSCAIAPVSGMSLIGLSVPGGASGTFAVFRLPMHGPFMADITYIASTGVQSVRRCQVNTLNPMSGNGAATSRAELTGFATDASGMVTTGVWRLRAVTPATAGTVTVTVPADFVAVGGGAMGQTSPYGALVTQSYHPETLSAGYNWRSWIAKTSDLAYPDPHYTTAYAIGMRITRSHPLGADITASALSGLLRIVPQSGNPGAASVASSQASIPFKQVGGFVPLSGSAKASADASNSFTLLGQFLTATAPLHDPCLTLEGCKPPPIKGWRAESKDHPIAPPHPGYVTSGLLGIAGSVTVDGVAYRVVGRYTMATSAVAAHPVVDVRGAQGYALTGIGAVVAWRDSPVRGWAEPPGNLIWKLEPRPDLLGASVAAKDHGYSSPAAITGYALGIRLAP